MIDPELKKLIQKLPKAENHLHFEGAVEPTTLLALAERNKIKLPFSDVEGAKKLYDFNSLNHFLEAFALACSTLCTAEDFASVALDLGADSQRQGIVYRELMFTYAYHQRRDIPLEVVLEGLIEGRRKVKERYGVEFRYIADIDRTISPEASLAYVERLAEYKDKARIVAIGLDSQEFGYPAALHQAAYKRASELGFHLTAHAGEDVGPESVWDAVQNLKVDRIDHGVRSVEDPKLVELLKQKQIPLTVCPLSNVDLKVYPSLDKHPVKEMLDLGLLVSLNSDDPPFFHSDLLDNYVGVTDTFNLSADEISALAVNGYRASYLSESEKADYIGKLTE